MSLPEKKPEKRIRSKTITSITTDKQLYEKAMRKSPDKPKATGDQKYPGIKGIRGEWIAKEQRWIEGRFYCTASYGYPQSERLSLGKAWFYKSLRQGHI
jgi:hypothetical protein